MFYDAAVSTVRIQKTEQWSEGGYGVPDKEHQGSSNEVRQLAPHERQHPRTKATVRKQ